MTDLLTTTPEELPDVGAVSAKAMTIVQEPGGPVVRIEIRRLLGRLISTDEATATVADLQAQLGYPVNSLALVFADPDAGANGWYRKTGAAGGGDWELFEQLSNQETMAAITASLTQVIGDGGGDTGRLGAAETAIDGVSRRATTLEGRADGLDSRADQAEEAIASYGATVGAWPRGAHRAWRIEITAGDFEYSVHLGDVQMRAIPGGVDQCGGGRPFGTPSIDNRPAAGAFDGNAGSEWIGDFVENSSRAYLGYLFAAPVSVNEIALIATAGASDASPKTFTVQFSDDTTDGFDGTWIDAWTPADQTGWAKSELRAFPDPLYGEPAKRVLLGSSAGPDLFVSRPGGGYDKLPVAGGGALSAFQQSVMPAMLLGRMPRYTPVLGYTLARLDDNTTSAPAGFPTFVRWDDASALRWEGAARLSAGPNDWSFTTTYNAGPFIPGQFVADASKFQCNGARFEFDTDAQSLVIVLMGGGGPFRILVDGDYIDEDDGKVWGYDQYPADGNTHRYKLTLGPLAAGKSSRRIMFDGYGVVELSGLWVPAGAQVRAPDEDPRPLVYLDGTSVVENGNGWARTFARVLNLDTWNCGVGSTGVINPGNAGAARTAMPARANWRHRTDWAFGVHQGVINDGDTNLNGLTWTDGSYLDARRKYMDAYRPMLDSWAATTGGRPWFALGYLPIYQGDTGINPLYFALCDAMEQVCAEYAGMAHFIPPIPHDGVFPGPGGNVSPTNLYLNNVKGGPVGSPADYTHPDWIGAPVLGQRIAKQIREPIYGRRF